MMLNLDKLINKGEWVYLKSSKELDDIITTKTNAFQKDGWVVTTINFGAFENIDAYHILVEEYISEPRKEKMIYAHITPATDILVSLNNEIVNMQERYEQIRKLAYDK